MLSAFAILALLASATVDAVHTTRYWDCAKPACAWPSNILARPARSCTKGGGTASNRLSESAFACGNQSPWVGANNIAYGYAAFGAPQSDTCGRCYSLTFSGGGIKGKRMIVQVINQSHDGPIAAQQSFDLAIPGGGGGGMYNCQNQYGNNPALRNGVTTAAGCNNLPGPLQAGCKWAYGPWFKNAINPDASYRRVKCPGALTGRSGLARKRD